MDRALKLLFQALLAPFGLKVLSRKEADLFYLHDYQGGYPEYKKLQVYYNKKKLNRVWADETTLDRIMDYMRESGMAPKSGICHGARNGFEVKYLREKLGADVIGTDISDTATQFPHMVVWDFHDPNPDWADKFDFVYTNSLDQAMMPDKAVSTWAAQLKPGGRIFIEHTMAHSPSDAGRMDPFGAHPLYMPYLLFKWGKGQYHLDEIIEIDAKANNARRAWVFVVARCRTGEEVSRFDPVSA